MSYDTQFQHGLSWLSSDEDEACASKILKAVYAAIYDENPNHDVTRCLLRAYDLQFESDYPDKPEPVTFEGDEAWKFCRAQYMKHALPHYKRYGIKATESGLDEVFGYPESLPSNYPIRRGILVSVAKRLAASDAFHAKSIREAYKAEAEAHAK
jgi:hypothetical protein